MNQKNLDVDRDLFHFYKRLEKNVLDYKNGQLENNSVLLTLVSSFSNKVSELLLESSIDSLIIPGSKLEVLEERGFIRKLNYLGKTQNYVMTILGIWQIETKTNNINIKRILDYFQSKKFSSDLDEKPLSDKEKIILFALIALRTFTLECAMDLKQKITLDVWEDIFDRCNQFLASVEIVEDKAWRSDNTGNEHPVSYAMRRLNKLSQKTKHIYQSPGKKKYYLDLFLDSQIDAPYVLQHLFDLIFKEIESSITLLEISTFLSDLAYNEAKNVKVPLDFITPEWDEKIENALEDYYFKL